MPNSSLIEQRCTIPSSDRAPRCHHSTTCSWRPSSPILPGLTFSTPDEVLGTHSGYPRTYTAASRLFLDETATSNLRRGHSIKWPQGGKMEPWGQRVTAAHDG